MTRSTTRLLVILVAALGSSAVLAAQRTYDKRLDAPPGGRLTFDADVGSVVIVGRDAPEVVLHADLEGSQSFLDGFRISAEQTSSGVTVSARGAHEGWLGWLGLFNFGSTHVRFDIEVPRGYPVDLRTSGGRIDVRTLNAEVRAETSGGGVVVQDVAGTVNAHTSGGSIEAERLNGQTKLTTSGGGITVTDSTGDLYARTSGGSIHIQNEDGRVDAHTSGGGIRAALRANRGAVLATSGGSITLLLPQDAHATIDATTSGGRVMSDLPVTTTEFARNDLRGTLAGGGPPISLHTSGGSIHIESE
jgi:hypothetical protein